MSQEKIDRLISIVEDAAEEFGLQKELVFAVILAESSLDPTATRFEPDFWRRYLKGNPDWTGHDFYAFPEVMASSFGLCQIMFTTAIWINTKKGGGLWGGDWWDLFDPKTNVRLACAVLAHKIGRYGVRDGVAAYNGGSPRKDSRGKLVPVLARYVRRVEGHLNQPLGDHWIKDLVT